MPSSDHIESSATEASAPPATVRTACKSCGVRQDMSAPQAAKAVKIKPGERAPQEWLTPEVQFLSPGCKSCGSRLLREHL